MVPGLCCDTWRFSRRCQCCVVTLWSLVDGAIIVVWHHEIWYIVATLWRDVISSVDGYQHFCVMPWSWVDWCLHFDVTQWKSVMGAHIIVLFLKISTGAHILVSLSENLYWVLTLLRHSVKVSNSAHITVSLSEDKYQVLTSGRHYFPEDCILDCNNVTYRWVVWCQVNCF
jgi:hypothetical protein